ncbi:MAG TPA: hypothetical protein VGQ71_14805, partial [Terriglobales bacterium]|nr:hypothetical protein [Terriglobales bacterium]
MAYSTTGNLPPVHCVSTLEETDFAPDEGTRAAIAAGKEDAMTWRVGLMVLATLTWVPQPSLAQVAPPAPVTSGRPEVRRSFRTVFVNSETVYLKSEHLQNALRQQPEFAQWGMQVSLDRAAADVVLEVHRPFLTFDWTYDLIDRRSGEKLVSGTVVASEGHRAALRIAEELMKQLAPGRTADNRSPEEALRTFHNLYVESHTIYMKTDVMLAALRAQPAISQWGINLVAEPQRADVTLTIHRPFMSFDWQYRMRHPASGRELGSGTIVAWDGPTAAPLLAGTIVSRIGSTRQAAPIPGGPAVLPAAATAAVRQWRVRLQSGAGLRSGMPLTVSMLPDRIVAADDQRAVFSIPAPDVVAVTHHTAVKGPASAWWNFWSGAAEDPGEALIALPVVLAVGALLELGRTNEHYITIDWREAGRLRELQLQVNSADHQPLLGELKAVTHRGWKSLPDEIHSL